MRSRLAALLAIFLLGLTVVWSQRAGVQQTPIALPSSKFLQEPVPGDPQRLNSFPANLAVSPDGRYVAILNAGWGTREASYGQSIALVDRQQNSVVDFPDPRVGKNSRQVYLYGIAFSADGRHVYASLGSLSDPAGRNTGDTGNGIAVYGITNGALQPEHFLAIAPQPVAAGRHRARALDKAPDGTAPPFPAGLAVLPGEPERLLVADNLSDDALLLDAASGRVLARFDLGSSREVPATYPYAVAVSRDARRAWVSLWNASQVAELDLAAGKVLRRIGLREPSQPTDAGSHPTALLLSPDEKYLYVALANRDEVAALDVAGNRPPRYLPTRLPGQQYPGAYPLGLAASADGKRLYVADASADAVAVFDVEHALAGSKASTAPLGFIPTEWYPTSLAVIGDELIVATAKGKGTGPNAGIPSVPAPVPSGAGILPLIAGSVARMPRAQTESNLVALTDQVLAANRMNGRLPDLAFAGGKNPIRHVIYIIKENRTYDQVFGDMAEGNGDPSLVMYGEAVSPNHHKLARQFGLLDNFYDSAEVSGDGHVWSNAAIASDYTERIVLLNYRGKERTYDFGGQVAEEIPLELGIPDVSEPGTGYFWANAAQHHLRYRSYGEFVATSFCELRPTTGANREENEIVTICPKKEINRGEPLPPGLGDPAGGPSQYPWPVPILAHIRPTKPELVGHIDPKYPSFNTSYPDQLRTDEFLREFAGFVAARKTGNGEQLPNYIVMQLPNDHTAGTRAGGPSPQALVADNDIALGRIVDAVSHSPYWDDTAICVLEDDAQNGQDHVDAHRSLALLISKYAPLPRDGKAFVDRRFYTTVNMVRTMEALLGLPPMNNNDARAAAMAPLFSGPGTQPAFTTDWRNRDNGLLYKVNPPSAPGSRQSSRMDFSRPDAADAAALNRILWRDAKGDIPMPAPKHTVIPEE